MAEDRMLNDEILLGLIKANSGGGGGGTTNYNQLENKPQIAGTELQGNKSLADLGIASAQSVESITNGESINTFAGVETALDGVATALALKQNATDNSLDTDAKTIVGAINEHEGDVESLKSGFTNLDNEVNGDATTYPYADVITIEDAVPSNLADCSVKIEPVQDLHGYDKPWVGGAGKNKLPMTVDGIKAANTDGTWSGNTYTYNDIVYTLVTDNDGNLVKITVNGTTTLRSFLIVGSMSGLIGQEVIMNGGASGGVASYTASGYCLFTGGIGVPQEYDIGSGATFTVSSNGGNVNINVNNTSVSNLDFYPMIRLATETDATFAPYTNICPISGHTEVDVQKDGVNLIENNTFSGVGTFIQSTVFPVTGAYIHRNATFSGSGAFTFKLFGIKNGIETVIDEAGYGVSFNDIRNNVSQYDHIRVSGYSNDATNSLTNIMVAFSDTDTPLPYEPYQGKTYTIIFKDAQGQTITVYGSDLDVKNGKLKVTHKYVDLGDYTWYTLQDNQFYTEGINDFAKASSGTTQYATDYICDKYVSANGFVDYTYISLYYNTSYSGYRCFVRNDPNTTSISTGADFKTYITGTHLCYKLATPTTIQLTPQQIQLLKGQNTLTASTGQISVTVNGVSGSIGQLTEYVADVQSGLIVDKSQSTEPVDVDGTFQIGANVLSHNIIIVGMHRYAYGASVVLQKEVLEAGLYANGCGIYVDQNTYVNFTVTSTGLLTIKGRATGWGAVNIMTYGIL